MVFILRVIAGTAKGHKLKTLEGLATRPTTDKVKGSLFNILANRIEGADVLDLFSGTGNLGIESLSRGAKSAVFVDRNKECTFIIRENLEHTKLLDKSTIINSEVLKICKYLVQDNRIFDIIFMDPPYNKNFIQETLNFITDNDILKKDGIIVVEHSKDDILPDDLKDLKRVRIKEYGKTMVSFFELVE